MPDIEAKPTDETQWPDRPFGMDDSWQSGDGPRPGQSDADKRPRIVRSWSGRRGYSMQNHY